MNSDSQKIKRNVKVTKEKSESLVNSPIENKNNSYSSEDLEKTTDSSSSNSSDNEEYDERHRTCDEENIDKPDDYEDMEMNKLNINDEDPFRKAPFKQATNAYLATSSNNVQIIQSVTSQTTEQIHKSAFQPYKRPEDPFTSAPFELNTKSNKINPFFNAPFTNYEVKKKQNQFDYNKFGPKKKTKKQSLKQEVNQTALNSEISGTSEYSKDKITSLTQSQSLNSITTTANVNAASIISSSAVNSTNISPSNCTGTIGKTTITTTTSVPQSTTIIDVINNSNNINSNNTPLSSSSSNSSSCTSFAMNLIDKPTASTSTTLTQSQLTIKQKSSTLPPLTIPLSAINYNNNATPGPNSVKQSTLPKFKPSNENLITTIYVNNSTNLSEGNNLKTTFSSTPIKHKNASSLLNEEFDKVNNNNSDKDKKQKNSASIIVSGKSSTNTTPIKSTSVSNKGFSNMSFNDS